MELNEFLEQANFCKENNVAEGSGCIGCKGEHDDHCADWLLKRSSCFKICSVCDQAESASTDNR